MYEVQVHVPPQPYNASAAAEWTDHTVIEQLETEQAELNEAREAARVLGESYRQVRIIKWAPGGDRFEVVI